MKKRLYIEVNEVPGGYLLTIEVNKTVIEHHIGVNLEGIEGLLYKGLNKSLLAMIIKEVKRRQKKGPIKGLLKL